MFTVSDVNLDRVLREIDMLSQFGRLPDGGITRYTFSEAHQKAVKQVAKWMVEAELAVKFDRWGNLYGRVPGFEGKKSVLTGSHVDSVPHGGNYDGPLGVLSSLEAVRMIREKGVDLKKPLEVVSFIEEEGARFSGLLGSRLATGRVPEDEVKSLKDRDGKAFLKALDEVLFPYPVEMENNLTERVDSYIELHIEQGRRLETAGIPIGVVIGIAGPNFMHIRLIGRSDHAGATVYEDRHDTLLAAAEVIVAIREKGVSQFTGKGHMTVGNINVKPNVVNVVAGETEMRIDFRAADDETERAMNATVTGLIEQACAKHNLQSQLLNLQSVPPSPTPSHIQEAVHNAVEQAGVLCQDIISWAAHDAMIMATVCNAGMIFVPCREGRSHCPEEFTSPEDIAAGIAVLANTLVALAT